MINVTAPSARILNPGQQQALDAIKEFLNSSDPVFILKGSAGTGKTTMVHQLCNFLKEQKISFKLTATTGRAAKVLSSKTNQQASTMHSMLYLFNEISGHDESGKDPWVSETGQLFLSFGVRDSAENIQHPAVIIIDEASMISHTTQTHKHTAVFGSGNLLNDLLQFAGKSKLIFVGVSCQLPPVAEESLSAVLSLHYWTKRGFVARLFELTDIVRQQQGNEILQVATLYRRRIISPIGKQLLSFPQPQQRNVFATLGKEAFLKEYVSISKQKGVTEAVAICHSNNHAFDLNRFMRRQLHGQQELQTGELLMVVQNSYDVNLVNGDQVLVEKVAFDCHKAGLTFLDITVKSLFDDTLYETKIIRNLLYNSQPGLSPSETQQLLIDFDQRMRNRGYSRNSLFYKNEMIKDPYLNALRAKFGYAITVHKAQGGEWKNVFLYLNSSIYAQVYDNPDGADKFHRWFYTAITRAKEKLIVNDCPFVVDFAYRHPEEHKKYWKEVQRLKKHKK